MMLIRHLRTILCGLVLATTWPAYAQFSADVGRPMLIAIADFDGAGIGTEIADVVRSDLQSSGLFQTIPVSTFAHLYVDVDLPPRFDDWRAIGAVGLVIGRVTLSGSSIKLSYRVWDVAGRRQAVGFTNTAPSNDRAMRQKLAHVVADQIYGRITGYVGYFEKGGTPPVRPPRIPTPVPPAIPPGPPSPPPIAAAPVPDPVTMSVQSLLLALGFDVGSVDGFMGPRTTRAIMDFQQRNGLPVDGRPSEALRARLQTAAPAPRPVSPPPQAPAQPLDRGPAFDDAEAQLRVRQAAAGVAAAARELEDARRALDVEQRRVVQTSEERELNRVAAQVLEGTVRAAQVKLREREVTLNDAQEVRRRGLAAGGR